MGNNSRETIDKRNKIKREWKKRIDPNSIPHQIEKICKDCGELKNHKWMSSFNVKGKPEYRCRCIDCQNKAFRKQRKTTTAKKLRSKRRKRTLIKLKQKAIDFLGGCCKKCGYQKSLAALTFHHRDPKNKEFEIGAIIDHSWDKVEKELRKCDLLCFNCHMELHYEEDGNDKKI